MPSSRRVGEVLAFAALYVLAARLGLTLGPVHTFAAPVWPPTGIALAVLLLGGARYWPGVALGAFVANQWAGAPIAVALAMGLGNTLEALLGAYLVRRIGAFDGSLDRLRHVVGLAAAAAVGTLVSATVGVSSLVVAGLVPAAAFPEAWRVWWLGDMVGALVIGSLLLAWSGARADLGRRQLAGAAALAASVVVAGLVIFLRTPTTAATGFLQACLLIPILAWVALRFGMRGATAAVFLASIIAVGATTLGRGPFVQETLSSSLLGLQAFLAIVAATLLLLGAVTAERAAALRSSEAALEDQKKARRRAELAEDALREADRRKNEFLGVLSHELRNPLAPVRNSVQILGRAPAGSEEADRARKVIERQVAHLTRLVDDLLDVTRISRGKIRLHRVRVDLADTVRHVASDHRAIFDWGGVRLELRIDRGPIWVDADPTRLAQIVGNLLHNAAKFTADGGHVLVRVHEEGSTAAVRISDDGIGIAAGLLPRVFEPFTQADETLDRSKGGLGLGLAFAKALVDLHGGTVEARSEGLGRGTEFVVSLPLATPGVVEAAPPRGVEPHAGRRRVLVIEDNPDTAETLRDLLELHDQEVALARDGREGLARIRSLKPDVVLCDIGLPELDGYEVARQVRLDAGASPTLVAVTGYALPDDRQRALDAGFDHHLAKPFDFADLERILARPPPSR